MEIESYAQLLSRKFNRGGVYMKIEKLTAKALERLDFNRYLLAVAVGKRAEELFRGAKPLVNLD